MSEDVFPAVLACPTSPQPMRVGLVRRQTYRNPRICCVQVYSFEDVVSTTQFLQARSYELKVGYATRLRYISSF
jgi:hypothetical protein